MNHHNINAIVYYLIVFIRYVLPITLVFIGIGRWSYAKSINNPEKQIMGVNFALKSILFLYIVTFILFLVVFNLDIHLLDKMNFPNKIISPAIALITVFLGLALLKFLLPILK